MDSTPFLAPPEPATREAAIADEASLSLTSMVETIQHDNLPPVAIGGADKNLSDPASSIIKALQLLQVVYLIFAGIVASFLASYNIVAFAVLAVAFFGYFGLFWYNVSSLLRTRENAIALAMRSFSVAAVLALSARPATYLDSLKSMSSLLCAPNILLLLVVSVLDWRWNGLFSSDN